VAGKECVWGSKLHYRFVLIVVASGNEERRCETRLPVRSR
jgi:hypothetical protein